MVMLKRNQRVTDNYLHVVCKLTGFLERTKDRGMVIFSWAPQMLILQHPSTGVFVSHCGWNSVIESIVVEMPLITFPQRAEQKMNARFEFVTVSNLTLPGFA